MDLVHLYFLKMHSFLEKYNRRLKLNVNSQNTEFEVITKIREETFSNDIPLLDLVQSEAKILRSNLEELDYATFLRDAYKLGEECLEEILKTRRKKDDYNVIHKNFLDFIDNYFQIQVDIQKNNQISPYCPILNQHPLEVRHGQLRVREYLIRACTAERKADISKSYGEGLAVLLLRNLSNVHDFGVLKIDNTDKPTPDFIVININKDVVCKQR